MFTVADLFQMKILKSADILTGKSGFERPVRNVGMLDYEYISGEIYDGFLPDDLVLSSFLSIKERPDLVVDAIRALADMGVSCAGIRKIYMDELPGDVISYAVSKNFCIFLFDEEVSFSEIIIQVFDNLKYDREGRPEEGLMEKLAERGGSPEEARALSLEIRPDFYEAGAVIYLQRDRRFLREDINQLQQLLPQDEKEVKGLVCRFRRGAAMLLTFSGRQGETGRKAEGEVMRETAEKCVSQLPGARVGASSLSKNLGGLGMALLEAVYACQFGKGEGKQPVFFQELGPYRLLMPLADSPWTVRYREAVLGPLFKGLSGDQKRNAILWETLDAYVSCGRDMTKTAERLNQHKNTVRYRIRQICGRLGLDMDSESDWVQLCLSSYLYKIQGPR